MDFNATNASFTDVEILFSDSLRVTLYVIYTIIIVFTVCMNGLVIYTYNSHGIQVTKFNLCLVHISASNIAQNIGIIPFIAVDLSTVGNKSKYIDSIICGFTDGLCGFFGGAFTCVICITFTSITRYLVIKKPLVGHVNKQKTKVYLTCFWLCGYLSLVPNLFSWELDQIHGFCVRKHLFSAITGLLYNALLFIFGLLVPTMVMTVTYLMTIYHLYKIQPTPSVANRSKLKHRKHVIVLLGALIAAFLVCWSPFGLYWMLSSLSYFGNNIQAEYEKSRLLRYILIPCLLAGVTNPVMYALTSSAFRKAIKRAFSMRIKVDYAFSLRGVKSPQIASRHETTDL